MGQFVRRRPRDIFEHDFVDLMGSQLCGVSLDLIPERCRVHRAPLTASRLDRLVVLDDLLSDPVVVAAHAVRPRVRLIVLVDKLSPEPKLICITV